MLPASQRHSRVSFRPSNARLSAVFLHHLPLTPHSKSKCWSTWAFHRGPPSPSSHSHGHAGKSATLNENRNTISLAEKINKAIYLCEQKSEERTEPAAPTLSLLVWYLPPSDATIWCSTDLVSGYGHSTVASWFVSSAFISLRYIYWCAQATQVQTLVPQDKGLNSVLPHFTCLAYKGGGWSLHPSSYLPPIRGKKTTMSSGCHVIWHYYAIISTMYMHVSACAWRARGGEVEGCLIQMKDCSYWVTRRTTKSTQPFQGGFNT